MTITDSKWQGKWIYSCVMPRDGINASSCGSPESYGAPWLRRTFECPEPAGHRYELRIAAPGWFECHINGVRVGEQVLAPVVTQFTEHTGYLTFDVTSLLHSGKNAIAVLLGNGWYNCQTGDVWQFMDAPWRNLPGMLLQLEEADSHEVLLVSDGKWRGVKSNVVLNGLRNGEYQDLRCGESAESVSSADYNDEEAPYAEIINPPPGELIEQKCESCVVAERIAPVKVWKLTNATVYDFGRNLTGWCEIDAMGPGGSEVVLNYSERIDDCGAIQRENIALFCKTGHFQEDKYILSGVKEEKNLHPHFAYHGFRYVSVQCWKEARLDRITACFIHNDFAEAGDFHSAGNRMLDTIQHMNRYTYLCNHTGIPTDCPHREKNGWTGDANIAFETGAWNFNIRLAGQHFARVLMDCQRRTGQLPGIAPTGGWGFNWGSGPGWDSYIFEAAYTSWLFYGDTDIMAEHYDGMMRYIQYCRRYHDCDGVVAFGLADWCPYNYNAPDAGLTSTAFYYNDVQRLALFAGILGKPAAERDELLALAERIREGVNRKFAQEDGGYDNNSLTALATPLHFGFAKYPEKTLDKLVRLVREKEHRADFGIFGAKFVLRVLGENGCLDDLLKIITQDNIPGWGYWVKIGATTFREMWDSTASQNHIMFGDPSACIFRYLAGIQPCANGSEGGFASIVLKPAVNLKELSDFKCSYRTPHGVVKSELTCSEDGLRTYHCTTPDCPVRLVLNGKTAELEPNRSYDFPVH